MAHLDAEVFLWLNGWVGRFAWVDVLMRLVVGDYLVPVLLSLVLFGLWFGARDPQQRTRLQYAVAAAAISLALVNLWISLINDVYFRPRPFTQYEVDLLFYAPTDSSFPANPAAIAFAVAAGLWGSVRRLGGVLFGVAALYGFSRVYAGVAYPLDVVAGGLLGIVTAYLVRRALALLEPAPTYCLRLLRFLCLA